MNYYTQKRRAYSVIRTLYAKDTDIKRIYMQIMNEFGFGKKIVDEYIELLKGE